MRVLLAGATGAIGGRLVPQLVEAGHQVTAITRSKEKLGMLSDLGAEAVVCDVFDAGRLGTVVARAEPDAVINQLTDLPQSLNPRKLKEYYAANNRVRREGTRNLLDAARRAGVSRFLAQGAAYWYAPTGGPVKTEEAPLYLDAPAPIGPAVQTMREIEDAVLSADGLEGIVLRYGMFYGPGTWYAKDGDVGRQVRKRRYPLIGKGEGTYSFIHVGDAASATVAALERARPGIYNVVDDDPATAAEWMPLYAEALGAKRPPRVPAFLARVIAGDALVKWSLGLRGASNEKIKREIGWRPQYESWRRGFFEDAAAFAPGGVAR
ncbi:MAG: NAD(P)-dependent oxidoreductase [Actinomycetota bacterium]|nr:NAD(P)-dependent oxidoreductase [Actinomycetota bacterium]